MAPPLKPIQPFYRVDFRNTPTLNVVYGRPLGETRIRLAGGAVHHREGKYYTHVDCQLEAIKLMRDKREELRTKYLCKIAEYTQLIRELEKEDGNMVPHPAK